MHAPGSEGDQRDGHEPQAPDGVDHGMAPLPRGDRQPHPHGEDDGQRGPREDAGQDSPVEGVTVQRRPDAGHGGSAHPVPR